MQIEPQEFLRLVETSKTLAVLDTESQGFQGDYGSIICGSIKFYGKPVETFAVGQLGNDKKVVRQIKESLEAADAWVTFFGKGHDIPLINTRLLKWGYEPVDPRPHIDMYYQLKYKTRMGSRSQAHFARWLELPSLKLDVSPDVWAGLAANFASNIRTIKQRCEGDVDTLTQLYERTKHLVRDIKR